MSTTEGDVKYQTFVRAIEGLAPAQATPFEAGKPLSPSKLKKLSKACEKKDGTGSEYAELRRKALVALAATRDPQVLEIIHSYADDQWTAVREGVAEALGTLGDPRATPLLVKLLDDSVPDVKRVALTSLGKLGDARASRTLLQVAVQEPSLRFAAADAILKCGQPAVSQLIAATRESDPGVVLESVVVLGRLKQAAAVEPLIEVLGSRFGLLRAHAAESLGMIADKKATPALAKLLSDFDPAVRMNAATALTRIADPRSVSALIAAAGDADADVARQVVHALGELDAKQAVPVLLPMLQRPEPELRGSVAEALGRIGDETAAIPLTGLFHDSDEGVRLKAVSAFRRFRTPTAVQPLIVLLDDPNAALRQRAVESLGEIRHQPTVDQLMQMLRADSAVEVRLAAAKALGQLKNPKAVPVLEEALDDEFTVRCRAIVAIGQIGDASSLPALLAMLRDPVPEVRYHATQALADLGSKNAVKGLEQLLDDENPMVARGAAKSLIALGDPRGEELLTGLEKRRKKRKPSAVAKAFSGLSPDALVGMFWPETPEQRMLIGGIAAAVVLLPAAIYVLAPLLSVPERVVPQGRPACSAISPNGSQVLVGTTTGKVDFFPGSGGSRSGGFVLPDGSVDGAIYGADADTLVLIQGKRVLVRRNGNLEALPELPGELQQVVRSPDRTRAAFASGTSIDVYDSKEFKTPTRLELPKTVMPGKFALGPSGKTLLSTTQKELVLYAIEGAPKEVWKTGLPGTPGALALSADGKLAAIAIASGPIVIYDLEKKAKPVELKSAVPSENSVLAFSADSSRLLSGSGAGLTLWNVAEKSEVKTTTGLFFDSVDFSADLKMAAGSSGEDISAAVVALETGDIKPINVPRK